jgi:hypothetical protein
LFHFVSLSWVLSFCEAWQGFINSWVLSFCEVWQGFIN